MGSPGNNPLSQREPVNNALMNRFCLRLVPLQFVCPPRAGHQPTEELRFGQLSPHWWRVGCPRGKLAPSAADPGKARGKGLSHTLGGWG